MKQPESERLRQVLREAVYEGGDLLLRRFGSQMTIENKEGINNLVTEVDKAVEEKVKSLIAAAFPDHGFLGEEFGSQNTAASPYQWILDPIDGTVNFAHGIPLCCVSLALCYHDELLLGAVYNPMMQEFYFAERGQGATLNGQPIHVSQKTDFSRACLVTGFPYSWDSKSEYPLQLFNAFVQAGLPVRRLGSAALDLCWVAAGRFDGFWEYNLQPWDVAAGYLLVREAGGQVTDFSATEATPFNRQTLATNGGIHSEMLREIQSIIHQNSTHG